MESYLIKNRKELFLDNLLSDYTHGIISYNDMIYTLSVRCNKEIKNIDIWYIINRLYE